MSGEIAEKLFDVQRAVQAVSPAPAVTAPAGIQPQTIGGVPAAPSTQAPSAVPPAPAGPVTLAEGWTPSSLKKIGQTDKIPAELYGVVAVDREADGNDLVVAYGKNTLFFFRVKGTEIVPFTRFAKSMQNHFLGVDAIDLDGDGSREILVTNLVEESVESFVLKRKGDVYEEAAGKIPYFLAVLHDWMGKPAVVGQYQGIDTPFQGKIVTLRWDGKGFAAGEPLPHDTNILPLSSGLPGIASARFGKEWRLVYTDAEAHLRVLDGDGKSRYKSKGQYGPPQDFFEWGPFIQLEGRRKPFHLRKEARVAPGGGENPLVLVPQGKGGILGGYDSPRLVLLQWDGGEFVEKAGTQGSGHFLSGADFLDPSRFPKGGKIVASVIEQSESLMRDKISRLLLFQVE